MQSRTWGAVLIVTVLCACSDNRGKQNKIQASATPQLQQTPQLFKPNQVQITTGPFAHAQTTNIAYLIAMDPDRLLAPYLREAQLPVKAESYGNWESSGLDGHIGGHYISALSLAWAASHDQQLGQRLDYMLSELATVQAANGGYIGGIPKSLAFWQEIAQGDIRADLFALNDRWVPLYNIDKIFHGLRDAYVIGQREQAGKMLDSLGHWMLNVTAALEDDDLQQMLHSEHGALNAVFADMAELFNRPRYLELAQRLTHQRIAQPLVARRDELTGLHANTQIPKVVGMLKVAQQGQQPQWAEAADFFWKTVSKQRSVVIGGNSVREHFHHADDFTPMIEDVEGPETCNTYNMMKLSKLLFQQTGDTDYVDFYERATYNHILSSQHPVHGGLVYFTPMRPGHYRKYSSVDDSMWCCVGSGIENHSKYNELIYAYDNAHLWVNLYIPSRLNWQAKGWQVDLQTAFPDSETVTLTLATITDKPKAFVLKLRQPDWLTQPFKVTVNGEAVNSTQQQGYVLIEHDWQDGDLIRFTLDARLYTEQLPDGQDYYAPMYGPVVLSTQVNAFADELLDFVSDDSRMGHIASGPVCPPQALPIMLGKPDAFIDALQRLPDDELRFKVSNHFAIANRNTNDAVSTTLIPFFRMHDARYQVYWPQMQDNAFDMFVANAQAKATAKAALKAQTVDQITPGEQQPEVEHEFVGENTQAGVNNGRHWRDASGWFGYSLINPKQRARFLRLTFFSGDVGRNFTIHLNDITLSAVSLPVGNPDDEFYSVDYPLPPEVANATEIDLKFIAEQGSVAGGIYGIRLMAEPVN